MATPAPAPVDGNSAFDSLVNALGHVSPAVQTYDDKGKKVFPDSQKVYVQLGTGSRSVTYTAPGKEGKASKGIKADKLALVVKDIVTTAKDSGAFREKTAEELTKMKQGLNTLKERMEIAQSKSWSSMFLHWIGITDGYDEALENLEASIEIVNKETLIKQLPLDIQALEKKNFELLADVRKLEEEIQDIEIAAKDDSTHKAIHEDNLSKGIYIDRSNRGLALIKKRETDIQTKSTDMASKQREISNNRKLIIEKFSKLAELRLGLT